MRNAMNRGDYLIRAYEFAKRGSELPQTKLTPDKVKAIREAKENRVDLLQHIR